MGKTVTVKVCGCSNCMMHGGGEILEALDKIREIDGLLEEGQEIQMGFENFVREKPHESESPVVEVNGECYITARAQTITTKVLEQLSKGV